MSRRSTRLGFTLIELLVVVAIISLLMAILLPSLGSAKHQAKTSACLSNLKGLGTAIATYSADNNNMIVPYYITGQNGYQDNWVNLLVAPGYAVVNNPSGTRTPLFCPEGVVMQDANYGWDVPSQKSDIGAQWLGKTSPDGKTTYWCNYAVSAVSKWTGKAWWDGSANYGSYFPGRDIDVPATSSSQPVAHMTDVEQPSTTIFAFDGMDFLAFGDTKRINLRHGPDGRSATNFLCMDGHAQTVKQNEFPNDTQNFYDFTVCDNDQNFPLKFTIRRTGWH